jgi:hypothetical protein
LEEFKFFVLFAVIVKEVKEEIILVQSEIGNIC